MPAIRAGLHIPRFPLLPTFPKRRRGTRNPMTLISSHNSLSTSSSSDSTLNNNNNNIISPWLLVGLGNPGKLYHQTRHNVGFAMLDAIAEAEGISVGTMQFKALFGKGHIGDIPVMLAKPQTFMNVSGESVGSIVSYFKVPLNQVLLMYDDMDLPFAKLRLLAKGGHGGHNGMRSVLNRFKGNQNIPRLRIGIGRPPGKMDPASFVLRSFDKKEKEELDFMFQKGVDAIRILMHEGISKSATYANTAKPSEAIIKSATDANTAKPSELLNR